MSWKLSGEKKVWSRWCVESSSTGNQAKQEISELDGCWAAAVKTNQMPTSSASEVGEDFSLAWEFLVPGGHPLGPACHNALKDFLRNYSCKRKGEKKCIWVCPYKKVNERWWSVLWLMNCRILTMMGFWESYHMSSLLLFLCLSDLFSWTLRTQVRLLELAGRKMSIFYPT